MLIGYGYGYPKNLLQGGLSAWAWVLYNTRCDVDPTGAALPAEAAVGACLFNRFDRLYTF